MFDVKSTQENRTQEMAHIQAPFWMLSVFQETIRFLYILLGFENKDFVFT